MSDGFVGLSILMRAEDELVLLCHQTLLHSSTIATTRRRARQLLLERSDHGQHVSLRNLLPTLTVSGAKRTNDISEKIENVATVCTSSTSEYTTASTIGPLREVFRSCSICGTIKHG